MKQKGLPLIAQFSDVIKLHNQPTFLLEKNDYLIKGQLDKPLKLKYKSNPEKEKRSIMFLY